MKKKKTLTFNCINKRPENFSPHFVKKKEKKYVFLFMKPPLLSKNPSFYVCFPWLR